MPRKAKAPQGEDTLREANRRKKERAKNSECYQLGFLIFLLVQHNREVVVQNTEKKSKKTEQYYHVSEVRTDQIFKLKEEAEKEALEKANLVQNEVQRKRYYQKNCMSVSFNWLVEMLEELGYSFDVLKSKESENTVKMKRFKKVKYAMQSYDKDVIDSVGKKTLEYLHQRFEENNNKEIVVDVRMNLTVSIETKENLQHKNEGEEKDDEKTLFEVEKKELFLEEPNPQQMEVCNKNTFSNASGLMSMATYPSATQYLPLVFDQENPPLFDDKQTFHFEKKEENETEAVTSFSSYLPTSTELSLGSNSTTFQYL
ncbi:hypothetical protein EIN_016260 [Entamoeba invadens IP1]|uniref:hypothetical protein n=1 Tax=Entamoeba invadens IP1 TaxID=370355 RepID=UPI0002C3CE1B|nr:hypothetical protein EIN_016260 [Entamoeba invadens IP1]ELP90407.1 hypothetical protein EIN_016260 [Entamoeba invadens IP1]|eukprot:XP_004257178.1 hypothetical protein EIN_016260 [Entamoeba invadens IP1]